jgi:hypothetical protein
MNCEQVPLLELVRCELDEDRIRTTLRHLEECRSCRERVRLMSLLELAGVEQARPRSAGVKKWYAVAAVVVLALVGAAILHRGGPVRFEPAALATREPYPLVLLDARSEAPRTSCREAFELYRSSRYAEAATAFGYCPAGAEIDFFRGVAEYLAGQPGDARRRLSAAAAVHSPWREPARWYEANACLLLRDLEAARGLLEELATSGGHYAEPAAELLSRLPETP